MDNIEVISLYEDSNKQRVDKFISKTQSTLKVDIDKSKITRDVEWIDMMNFTVPYIDNIFRSPNRFIVNEEEIVKVEQAKKITVETIKHLSKNTNFIQKIDEKTGDVTPSKLLNVRKEETYDTYENRFIYTLVKNMKLFVRTRKEVIFKDLDVKGSSDGKDNKTLKYNATSNVGLEEVEVNVSLNSRMKESKSKENNSAKELAEKIEELEKNIMILESTEVFQTLDKLHVAEVRDPIKKTNVILKNVNFQYAMKLWSFLRDNLEDKTTNVEEKRNYMDNGTLKKMMDETFLLQYLTMKTLDEDQDENQDTKEEIQNVILEQMIDKLLDMNENLTEEQLKKLIANRYEVIKYKKFEVMQDIQKIYKEYIKKYLQKIEK